MGRISTRDFMVIDIYNKAPKSPYQNHTAGFDIHMYFFQFKLVDSDPRNVTTEDMLYLVHSQIRRWLATWQTLLHLVYLIIIVVFHY